MRAPLRGRGPNLLALVSASLLVKLASLAFILAAVGGPLVDQLSTKWDSNYYVSIAQNWYPVGHVNGNYAFAPLYPVLIRGVDSLVGSYAVSAALVANVASVLCPIVFYFVAETYFSPRESLSAALALTVFPTFVTYGLVSYSEPVYILFSMLSVCFFLRKRYALTGVAASFGVLSSYVSILVPALLLAIVALHAVWPRRSQAPPDGGALQERDASGPPLGVVWLFVPFLVFGLWNYYLDVRSGQMLAALAAQSLWGSGVANPVAQFEYFFTGVFSTQGDPVQQLLMRYAYTLTFFALAVPLWKIDRGLAFYSSSVMLFVLSLTGTAYMSGPRLMLSAWPLLLVFGKAKKEVLLAVIVLFVLFSLQSTYTELTSFWT